jgi:protoheme IX farnesyltransferase
MSAPLPVVVPARLDRAGLSALLRPRILGLVVVEAGAAYLVERPASLAPLPWLLSGTLLVSAAGCALNHWLERDTDARMERTRGRPLVTGALSPTQVLAGGVLALLAGLGLLAFGCHPLTVALEAFAALLYLGVYTPLKRATSANTWVGAIPGALPVLAGAAAVDGRLSASAWMLFGLIVLWQMPHFFAIASMYREQYRSGGLRMLSGDDPEDRLLRWQLPVLVMSVILLSIVPVLVGTAGPLYAVVALVLGAVFLESAFRFRGRPDRPRARRVVLASVLYLPVVLLALVTDVACIGRAPEGGGGVLAAGGQGSIAPADDGTGLPVYGELPDFELVDQDGQPFTRASLAGEPWVVDFIFTSCGGVCVPMTRRMVDLQAEGLDARFLSVSVDPSRDGPPVLKGFREKWDGDESRWSLVVGSHEAVMGLANQAFKLPAGTGTGPGGTAVDGMPELFHSQRFALLDGRSRVRGYYAHDDELAIAQLRRDVAALRAAGE